MKKGFTLIELLGVIVIIAVIATVAVIAIDNSIRKGKITSCKAQEENIIEAAKTWQTDNPIIDIRDGAITKVYIRNDDGDISKKDLTTSGYLDKELKNPMTNKVYNSGSYVEIKVNTNTDSDSDRLGYTYTVMYDGESSCE